MPLQACYGTDFFVPIHQYNTGDTFNSNRMNTLKSPYYILLSRCYLFVNNVDCKHPKTLRIKIFFVNSSNFFFFFSHRISSNLTFHAWLQPVSRYHKIYITECVYLAWNIHRNKSVLKICTDSCPVCLPSHSEKKLHHYSWTCVTDTYKYVDARETRTHESRYWLS